MIRRVLLALIPLALLPVAGFAQNSMLRGKVRGNDGVVLNNAAVELRGSSGAGVGQAFTRNDGDFVFTRLRSGEYELHVSLSGYEPSLPMVEIRSSMRFTGASEVISEVVTVEVMLKRRAEPSLAPPGTSFAQDVPKVARVAYLKGISKLREGKSGEGMRALREPITECSDYFDAHLALGSEFYRIGKDEEALESLEKARQIYDKGAVVYYTFGLIMVRQQKFRAAEYAFGKAAELNDTHINSHFNHAVALIEVAVRSKDKNEVETALANADRELDRAWELSGKKLYTVFLQRARIFEERGDKKGAARKLKNYLKADPE